MRVRPACRNGWHRDPRYDKVFGTANAGTVLDAGTGAAVGVLVAVLVLITYAVMNKLLKEEALEY